MADVHDVAAGIIKAIQPDQLQLNKILYYAQGWSVTWRQSPLFDDTLEGWEHGPVVETIYQAYKQYGKNPITEPAKGSPDALSDDESGVLAAVLTRYGSMSGLALRRLTHEDAAWESAWAKRSSPTRGREPIPPDAIARSLREAALREPNPPDTDDELVGRVIEGDGDALAALLGATPAGLWWTKEGTNFLGHR